MMVNVSPVALFRVCTYYAVSIALSRSVSIITTALFIMCGVGILQGVYAELFNKPADQPDVFKTVAHLDLSGRDDDTSNLSTVTVQYSST